MSIFKELRQCKWGKAWAMHRDEPVTPARGQSRNRARVYRLGKGMEWRRTECAKVAAAILPSAETVYPRYCTRPDRKTQLHGCSWQRTGRCRLGNARSVRKFRQCARPPCVTLTQQGAR